MSTTVRIRLKDILKERNMSQNQLALLSNLRPSTINNLCKPSVSGIYLSTIAVLCDVLQISISDLIGMNLDEHN